MVKETVNWGNKLEKCQISQSAKHADVRFASTIVQAVSSSNKIPWTNQATYSSDCVSQDIMQRLHEEQRLIEHSVIWQRFQQNRKVDCSSFKLARRR